MITIMSNVLCVTVNEAVFGNATIIAIIAPITVVIVIIGAYIRYE